MADLSEAAIVLGRVMGQDATKSLDDLTTALGRSSPLILDNLGLTVKVGEANKAYAATLGKTTKELTDAEKKMAFYNAAMDAAKSKVAELGEVQLTFADRMVQVQVSMQNFIDLLGEAIATSPALNKALGIIVDTMQRAFGANQVATVSTLTRHVEGFAKGLITVGQVGTTVAKFLTTTWRGLQLLFNLVAEAIVKQAAFMLQALAGFVEAASNIPLIGSKFDGVAESIQGAATSTRELAGGFQAQAKAALDAAGEERAAFDSASEFLTGLREEMDKATVAGVTMGKEVTAAVEDIAEATWDAKEATKQLSLEQRLAAALMKDELDEFKRQEAAAAKLREQLAEEGVRSYEMMADELRDLATTGGNFSDGFADSVAKLPDVIIGALQGGGDLFRAVGASIGADMGVELGKTLSAAIGGTLGKTLGSLAGPLGALAGSALGGLFDSLFGADPEEEVNDLRDAFFDLNGGFVAVQQSLVGLTDQDLVKKIFDARTVDEFNAAIAEVNSLLGLQGQAQADLEDAVKRYGFSIEELGPKFQQQELDKMVGGLLKDYELLVASGIDVNTVIEKMGPNFQEYVDTALAAGAALPESMRPIIQSMIDQGILLDANGDAFESIEETGLSFTESLSDGLSRVIDSIEKLVAALTGIPPVEIPVTYTETNRPRPPSGQASGEENLARGGVVLPFRPRAAAEGLVVPSSAGGELVRMGEGGEPELAAPVKALLATMQETALMAAGGGEQRIVVEVDGQVLSEVVVRRNRAGLLPIRESSVRRY